MGVVKRPGVTEFQVKKRRGAEHQGFLQKGSETLLFATDLSEPMECAVQGMNPPVAFRQPKC